MESVGTEKAEFTPQGILEGHSDQVTSIVSGFS